MISKTAYSLPFTLDLRIESRLQRDFKGTIVQPETPEQGTRGMDDHGPEANHSCKCEPALVAKIAKIKVDQARRMMTDAREKVRDVKKTIRPLLPKTQYVELLKEISKIRTRVWDKARAKHKAKMDFLTKKYSNCCKKHVDQGAWSRARGGDRKIRKTLTPAAAETTTTPATTVTTTTTSETTSASRMDPGEPGRVYHDHVDPS